MKIRLSVLICTKNRPKSLLRLFSCIKNQTISPSEIVIVEDVASNKYFNLKKIKNIFPTWKIKYTSVKNVGHGISRNTCLRQAAGDIVIFFDDDVQFYPDFFARTLDCFYQHRNIDGWVGNILPMRKNLWSEFSSRQFTHGLIHTKSIMPIKTHSLAFAAFRRKKLVNQNINFNKQLLTGEDTDFFLKLLSKKLSVYFSPMLTVRHEFKHTFLGFFKQYANYALSYRLLSQLHPDCLSIQNYLPSRKLEYFLFPLFLVKNILAVSREISNEINLPKKYANAAVVYSCATHLGVWFSLMLPANALQHRK